MKDRERPKFPENTYYAEGIAEPITMKFTHLPWYKKIGWAGPSKHGKLNP